MILSLQVAEEQQHQLAQVRSELADRLLLNRQRLEEEHATLVEAQAQVCCCLSVCLSVHGGDPCNATTPCVPVFHSCFWNPMPSMFPSRLCLTQVFRFVCGNFVQCHRAAQPALFTIACVCLRLPDMWHKRVPHVRFKTVQHIQSHLPCTFIRYCNVQGL